MLAQSLLPVSASPCTPRGCQGAGVLPSLGELFPGLKLHICASVHCIFLGHFTNLSTFAHVQVPQQLQYLKIYPATFEITFQVIIDQPMWRGLCPWGLLLRSQYPQTWKGSNVKIIWKLWSCITIQKTGCPVISNFK